MIRFNEWYFPDGETQLPAIMAAQQIAIDGRLTWQYHKYTAALACCRQVRRAIDIGAHVGLFSYWMARDCHAVAAFEPIAAHRECWMANMPTDKGVVYECALGAYEATVTLATHRGETGGTHISEHGAQATMLTLDSFNFDDVDFIKIDVEGYEAAVIDGARQTITRWRPIMLSEEGASVSGG